MRLLLILLFCTFILFASDKANDVKVQIIEKILLEVSIGAELVIWSNNQSLLSAIEKNTQLKTTDIYNNANLIVLDEHLEDTHRYKEKYIFVLNYNLLSEIQQSFGALFWKKGRANIILLEPRLKLQGIEISQELEPYLEERIW